MVRRTKEQAEETRAAILDAAEAVFITHGVARTSLAQIAQRAGVTRGAIYWHFKDKGDLLLAMRERVDEPVWAWLVARRHSDGGDPLGVLEAACVEVLDRLVRDERYRRVHTIFLTRCEMDVDGGPDFLSQLQMEDHRLGELVRDFTQAQQLGHLRSGLSPRLAALSLFSLMQGIFLSWLRSHERFTLATDGRGMVRFFFTSVRAQPGGHGESGQPRGTRADRDAGVGSSRH